MSNKADKLETTTTVVIGDGWSALGAVGILRLQKVPVVWLAQSATRIEPVLPSLSAAGVPLWGALAEKILGGDWASGVESGSFLREFKNKSFRPADPHALEERLWASERAFSREGEVRFSVPLAEIEARLRARILGEPPFFEDLKRIEETPLSAIRFDEEGRVQSVGLGSGEEIACSRVVYADRWSGLPEVTGLPKALGFIRKRGAGGLLQLGLHHDAAHSGGAPLEAYFAPLSRDAGEDFDRHAWGYFSADGRRSVWSVCVTPEEGEDNRVLSKKLRKLKNAVEKMFGGTEFLKNVQDERLVFQEFAVFSEGEPPTGAVTLPKHEGLYFFTDGYGPSQAFRALVSWAGGDFLQQSRGDDAQDLPGPHA